MAKSLRPILEIVKKLELPEKYKSLNETAFYVSGFNTIVDNLILPPTYLTLKLFGKFAIKPLASLFQWSLKKYSKPPYNIILKLEAFGKSNGENRKFNMILQHRDGYEMTAIPIVAFLLQYLDGTARKPGVHFQANIVEPVNFFKSISELGIEIIENMN